MPRNETVTWTVLVLSTAVAMAAIAIVLTSCGIDGGCSVAGAEVDSRHLGVVTTANGLLISALALS